jgi:magnesium transporter
MFSEVRRRAKKVGQAPGTPVYTGNKKSVEPSIRVTTYDANNCQHATGLQLEDCLKNVPSGGVTWVDVTGLNNTHLIEQICQRFHLHPLTVEDILNVEQRSKVEEFEGYLYITLKVLRWNTKNMTFKVSQLSLILGKDFVLSFHEAPSSIFDSLHSRIESSANQRLRQQGSDYLVYRLIDIVVDQYFLVLEALGDQIETVEDNIISSPSPSTTKVIYRLRRQMLMLRKAIWPIREAIGHLTHAEDELVTKFTRVYMRDVYDHTVQAIDTVETFRDMLSGMLEMYLSSLTNRMNEIMKTLTIITTIFIPITAIASIYGMNFDFIPGLHWEYGYPTAITLMLAIAAGMMVYFKKKNWI